PRRADRFPRWSTVGWPAVSAVLLLVALALALIHFRERPVESRPISFLVNPPEGAAFGPSAPAISPDGTRLAFVASVVASGGRTQLWIRPLDSVAAQPLAGTEGAAHPFWSPDGRFIGFFAQKKVKKIAASGGPVQTLCDAAFGFGGAWNRDGVL